MSQRAKDLSTRLRSFGDEVIACVENLSDQDWTKTGEWEQWGVGVIAWHLGAGHFGIRDWCDMIVRGEALPPLTMDQINEMSNEQARANAGATKAEALEVLKANSATMVTYVAGLTDEELDCKASMPAFGGEVTTEQFIDFILLQNAAQHYESMKAAVGR